MSFRTIINRDGSQWMKGAGPEQDVVIGSRIRLARNIRGIPFPGAASHEDRAKVLEMVKGATALAKNLGQIEFVRLEEVSPLDRRLLVERHLISPQLAAQEKDRAVILRDDEAVSIMVNEEDHIRIQVLFPGMQLMDAWEMCSRLDDLYSEQLDFAFSPDLGYLTACPTNLGTGLRASVMLHLPGMTITDQIRRMLTAMGSFGLVVRGLYGEGTEVVGNIYQLSNQVTLGPSEEEIISHLENITRQIIAQEREAREALRQRGDIEDRLYRSYGILAHARSISSHEAMELLSDVRLGIDMGLFKGLAPTILQELLVLIRPAHLQKMVGRKMDAGERDRQRAALIRERIRTLHD
ncbi:MAG: protein arginine kinase [Firmicutes bacterium]|jgi:protein arginine kinase|nr:protein arginine kinase [Bacillota bacterium]